jgi:superfamily II DNA/RNA helicase
MKFEELKINDNIKRAIKDMKLEDLTEIQEKSIPLILNNENVLGKSVTGSGKTFAFAIPCLEQALQGKRTIVISPTRELAVQLEKEFRKLAKFTKIKSTAVYGGHGMFLEVKKLKEDIHIVCGTPGRILDHLMNKNIKKDYFDNLVLDEADRLLDMGFLCEVKSIIEKVNPKKMHLFSATLDNKIVNLIKSHLKSYKEVSAQVKELKNILEEKITLRNSEKYPKLLEIVKNNVDARIMIFVATKKSAETIKSKLDKQGFFINSIHGDKTQNFREKALNDFKSKKVPILIATDVASRGLHIDDVDLVINYDLSNDPDVYTHRIGRTGRMGKKGKAITFISEEHYFADKNKKFEVKSLDFNPREYMRRKENRNRDFKEKRDFRDKKDFKTRDSRDKDESRGRKPFGDKKEFKDKKDFREKRNFRSKDSKFPDMPRGPRGRDSSKDKLTYEKKTHQGLSDVKDLKPKRKVVDKNKQFKSRSKNKNVKFQGRFTKKVN